MLDVFYLCLISEADYKFHNDKLTRACEQQAQTPLKVQKNLVDLIKQTIQDPPQKSQALHKLIALKVLNKIVNIKNPDLNKYAEDTILESLVQIAGKNEQNSLEGAQSMLIRGQNIFGPEEQDIHRSASFLVYLLNCIEKWALSSFESETAGESRFNEVYQLLLKKGIQFPSSFRERSDLNNESSIDSSRDFGTNSSRSSINSLQAEKREEIGALKSKLKQVKDVAKRARKLVNDDAYIEQDDLYQDKLDFEVAQALCSESISQLQNSQISVHISNSKSLIEIM